MSVSVECFRRVDGRLVRWVVNVSAPAYGVIMTLKPVLIQSCRPHNGFYEIATNPHDGAFMSRDVSHLNVEDLRE